MTALVLDQLRKSYTAAGQAALHGLNLKVESGSLTALLGPSGSGKTTTMKLIAGLTAPDSGDIRLGDRSIRDLPPERRGVAMVFQNPLLFPHLTVAGNVGFGLRMRGLPEDRIAASVREMLDRVHLSDLAQRNPVQLSGGQAQRVALARALILRPDVLLLDEPLSSLDPALRDDMRQLIRSLQRETGITTIVVTHDQTEAVALADRIALLLEGRLAQHDAPHAFYARPATKAVARFFGGANFIPGTVRSGQFESGLGPLSLPPGLPEGPGLLTIRPESLRLGEGPNSRMAQIVSLTFLGSLTRVDLVVSGIGLQAFVSPDCARSLAPGAKTALSLPPDVLWVLPPDGSVPPPR
ncbi:MAG: ABC transporter ATP-binding protein [Tabrizicola sp.]